MPGDLGIFQINDIVLNIPPEQIHVSKKAVNHMWNTLRTKSSIKSKSSLSYCSIIVTCKFTTSIQNTLTETSIENGLEQLRHLVSQFRVTPFCYVENQYIRNSILGGSPEPNMALALQQIQIVKEDDSVNCVEARMFFQWFNYYPFLNEWTYKQNFFSALSVDDPRQSVPWKIMYQAEQRRGNYLPIKKLNSASTHMRFRQFASLSVEQYQNIEKDFEALKQLKDEVATNLSRNTDSKINANSLIQKSLAASRGKERGKLLADEIFGHITSMGPEYLTLETVAIVLDNTLAPSANNRFSLLNQSVWTPVFNNKGEAITMGNTPQKKRRELGEQDPENIFLLERERYLGLGPDSGLIVTGITISFENVLAQLPLIGHQYPTFQHIGSVDGVVTMNIVATREESLAALTNFYNTIEDQAHKFKNIPQGQRNIYLGNDLANMCGLYYFLPNALTTDTIPGQPGTYAATLELIDNPIDPTTKEAIQPGQQFQTRMDIRNTVSDILLNNITLRLNNGGRGEYIYAPKGNTSGDAVRNFAFKSLCEEYAQNLTTLYNDLRDVLTKRVPPIGEFFSLDDETCPGIQRLQRDIFEVLKRFRSINENLSNPSSVDAARRQADLNIERSIHLGILNRDRLRDIRRGDIKTSEATVEFLKKGLIDTIDELQVNRVANFVNANLQDWLAFCIPFLDNIVFSGLVNLEQFKPVQKILEENTMNSSGNCYPDFPLEQVIQIMASSDEEAINSAIHELSLQAKSKSFGSRNKGLSSLIQPDFYMYNRLTDDVNEVIPFKVQQAAINAILEAQGGNADDVESREAAERTWVEKSYELKLGNLLSNQIRQDSINQNFDQGFWETVHENNDQKQLMESVHEAIRAQIQLQDGTFHYDDLVDMEEGLGCSIFTEEEFEGSGPIELPKMDLTAFNVLGADRTPGMMVLKTRNNSQLVSNPNHHAKAKHRFGVDSIGFKGETAYTPAVPDDPNREPKWSWPTLPGCRLVPKNGKFNPNRFHPVLKVIRAHQGMDISGRGVSNTYQLPVFAAADGKVIYVSRHPWGEGQNDSQAGNSITIQHSGGYKTKYFHLDWSQETIAMSDRFHGRGIWVGQGGPFKVLQGQTIGRIGNTGISTGDKGVRGSGAHLHFEMWEGNRPIDPHPRLNGEERKSQGPLVGINPTNESLLTKSIEQLEKDMKTGQGYSLMRAYPTFRLYFIESDLGERRRFGFDDFFSYSSVKDIKVIRSRKIGVDLAIITLTNVSGVLSNRKFKETSDPNDAHNTEGRKVSEDPNKRTLTNTADENPIASLMLKPGQQMQLRLGYNSDPDELETVMNGVITDVQFTDSDDMVQIICQSFAVELVQNQHGEVKTFGGFLSSTGRTGKLLEQLLTFPEVVHFGRWEGGKATNTVYGVLRNEWNFVPSPQDDNIFAPHGRGLWGLFDSTEKFVLYQSTIWDVFQEMTLRHPSYIAYPVPYEGKWGPRMTMFFGVPDQLYFARDPSFSEDRKIDGLTQIVNDAINNLQDNRSDLNNLINPTKSISEAKPSAIGAAISSAVSLVNPFLGTLTQVTAALINKAKRNSSLEGARKHWIRNQLKSYSLDQGFIKPFRNYHVITSTQHILSNSIESSSNVFNTTTLQYSNKAPGVNPNSAELEFGNLDTFSLKADAAIKEEDVRELFAQYPNCVGYEMAKRYAVGLLFYSLKETYRGSLVIIGNPKIKPYDICYLFDEYSDMFGPIEVEQVVHKFSQETGFVTEITPDLVVHVNQHTTMSSSDAMGLMAEYAMKQQPLSSLPSLLFKAPSAVAAGITGGVGGAALATTAGAAVSSVAAVAAIAGAGSVILNYAFTPIANMFFNSSEHSLSQETTGTLFGLTGTFIFKKLITRSQLAHPFRYSPLVKGGNAMVGGLPIKKTGGTFIQSIGEDVRKWAKEADEGIGLLLTDLYDKYHPNNWAGHSQGDFVDTLFSR